MTPVTVPVSTRAKAVMERAGQPGTKEHDALEQVLGHRMPEENGSAEHVLEAFAHVIEDRVAASGYQAFAERMTDEDHAFYKAANKLSLGHLLDA